MYFPLQSVAGKPGTTTGDGLHIQSQIYCCHGTAGSSVADSHLSGCQHFIPLRMEFFCFCNTNFNGCNSLFPCHGRLFRHIFRSISDFSFFHPWGVHCHADIHRTDLGSGPSAHDRYAGFFIQEVLRNRRRYFLPALGHAFLYHTIIRTHDDQCFPINMHISGALDSRNLDQCFLQPPQTS